MAQDLTLRSSSLLYPFLPSPQPPSAFTTFRLCETFSWKKIIWIKAKLPQVTNSNTIHRRNSKPKIKTEKIGDGLRNDQIDAFWLNFPPWLLAQKPEISEILGNPVCLLGSGSPSVTSLLSPVLPPYYSSLPFTINYTNATSRTKTREMPSIPEQNNFSAIVWTYSNSI